MIIRYGVEFGNIGNIPAELTFDLSTNATHKIYKFTAGTGSITI